MNAQNISKNKHVKLIILLAIPVVLIASYFIYKYAYIYTERKKYDQAEIVLQKVASDLRAQGIETEYSRGCGHAQVLYGKGPVSCTVGITARINIKINPESENLINILTNNGLTLINGDNIQDSTDTILQISKLKNNNQVFDVINDVDRKDFELYFSKPANFILF